MHIHTDSVLVIVLEQIDGTVDCIPCLYQCCMQLDIYFLRKKPPFF